MDAGDLLVKLVHAIWQVQRTSVFALLPPSLKTLTFAKGSGVASRRDERSDAPYQPPVGLDRRSRDRFIQLICGVVPSSHVTAPIPPSVTFLARWQDGDFGGAGPAVPIDFAQGREAEETALLPAQTWHSEATGCSGCWQMFPPPRWSSNRFRPRSFRSGNSRPCRWDFRPGAGDK